MICFIQVNHSPSFGIDTPFDLALKTKLILETLALVRAASSVLACSTASAMIVQVL